MNLIIIDYDNVILNDQDFTEDIIFEQLGIDFWFLIWHESEALLNRISALIKETPEFSWSPSAM